MLRINHLITPCLAFSIYILTGCGGSSKENSESLKIQDMEIKRNEITTEDGTKGFKGDIDNTNLQTIYEGLAFEKVYLVDGSDNPINGEEVMINSKFSIVFDGIRNFTLVNGKAFPKMSMLITGESGAVVNEEDILAGYTDGLSPEDASVLRATFTVGEPMVSGQQYMCSVNIVDKNNQSAVIQSIWLFTVK